MKRTLLRTKDKARFEVTFDEYGVADTITKDGKLLTSTHRDARTILRHADRLYAGVLPDGFTYDRSKS